jgi:hypothetical protein
MPKQMTAITMTITIQREVENALTFATSAKSVVVVGVVPAVSGVVDIGTLVVLLLDILRDDSSLVVSVRLACDVGVVVVRVAFANTGAVL